MIDIHPQNPLYARRAVRRFAASSAPLLLASALLSPHSDAIAANTGKVVRTPSKNSVKVPAKHVKVPASAMAALAYARRLQRDAKGGDTAMHLHIEMALRQAVADAPHWIEAHRALAHWNSSRRMWSAAVASWQGVLRLRPSDREALNQLERAQRWTRAFPQYSPWQDVKLVGYGYSLNEETSGLITLRSSAQTCPSAVRGPQIRPAQVSKSDAKVAVKASVKAASKAQGATPEEIRAALGVITDKGGGETSTTHLNTTQVPEDTPTIQITNEGAMPGIALPEAPAGVPEEARIALARARQMSALASYLPEADIWAAEEYRRVGELAPRWVQAQRERAQWHMERDEWSEASAAWEAVLDVVPADREARAALTRTRQFAFTFDVWGERHLVSFGHDSENPRAQEAGATLALAAAPSLSTAVRVAAASGSTDEAMNSRKLAHQERKDVKPKSTPRVAARSTKRAGTKIATTKATTKVLSTALTSPALAQPLPTINKSAVRMTQAPIEHKWVQPEKKVTPAIAIPSLIVQASPQLAPSLTPESATSTASAPANGAAASTSAAPTSNGTTGAAPAVPTLVPLLEPVATQPTPRAVAPTAQATPRATAPKPATKPRPKPAVKSVAKPASSPRVTKPVSATVSKQRQAAAWPLVNSGGKAMQAKNFAAALNYYQRAYALDPNNPYAALGVPEALMILKRYPEAIRGYERFLAKHPGHPKGLRGLADSYAFSGQYDKATRINTQILAKNPRDFAAAHQAAQVMNWSKNYDEAGRFYRQALAIQPNNSVVWTEYAEMLSFAKDPRAREAFGQALRLNPESQPAMVGLANLLNWSGEYSNAIPLYRGIIAREPSNLLAHIGLGDALTFSSQSAAAIPVYQQALQLSPTSVQARLGLGRALTVARRYPEAINLLGPLVKEQPTNTEALNMLAVAQISEQPGTALAAFQNLLKLQDEPRARAATLANIGDLQMKLGQLVEARASYEEALQLAPDDTPTSLSFARMLIRQELFNDAEPLIAAVLQRDGTNQSALLLQATLAARTDQGERAAALARQVEALPLEVSDDALNLFYSLRSVGETEAANRLLARLTEVGATRPEDAIKVANAVRDTGQEEASYELYQRILQTNPDLHDARLELAEALVRRKEFETAQKEVDYVLAKQPNNVNAKVLGATLALRRDDNEASRENAEIVFREAIQNNPGNMPARLGLAEVLGTRSKFLEAAQTYRAVLEVDPENLPARLGLARNLYYAKQVPESIKEYQDLIMRAPDDATIKLELAQVYLDRNLLEDAQRLFVDVLKASNYPLPENDAVQISRRVPGSGEIVNDATRRAFRDFAAQERQNAAKRKQ